MDIDIFQKEFARRVQQEFEGKPEGFSLSTPRPKLSRKTAQSNIRIGSPTRQIGWNATMGKILRLDREKEAIENSAPGP